MVYMRQTSRGCAAEENVAFLVYFNGFYPVMSV
jgi:hypothetical protein